LDRAPLDEAGGILLGPLAFFHRARVRATLTTALTDRLLTKRGSHR
jgi:hypothetical protein